MPSVHCQPPAVIRIGTRKSPLAMVQAQLVAEKLMEAHAGLQVEICPMSTTGDARLAGPLAEIGGKGLFTKELEEALLDKRIDIAVHSAKDMETHLPKGLIIGAVLEREDARDVLITPNNAAFSELPKNATLGTASLRRAAQALHLRPDLNIVTFRGNVQTRLEKLARGEADATMLAMAGLKRLKLDPLPGIPLSVRQFIPAAGQGIIAIECREGDSQLTDLLVAIHHPPTMTALICERALLAELDGSCRTPIGAYAEVHGDKIHLRAMLASIDGSDCQFAEGEGKIAEAEELGKNVAQKLKRFS